MAGLLDLTSQQGMMAQNAADDALEAQGKLYEHNEGIKAQNWQEAGGLVRGLAGSYAKYKAAKKQEQDDAAKNGGDEAHKMFGMGGNGNAPSPSAMSVIGGTLRNMFAPSGDQ